MDTPKRWTVAPEKEVITEMITLAEILQFMSLIVDVISLLFLASNKKK